MKISVAGTGYVGLVTGVCLAEKGYGVTCIDVDEGKIEAMKKGISPIYEPQLEELMKKNRDKLIFTTSYKEAYHDSDIIFIAVGTPEKEDGSADLTFVFKVSEEIAKSISRDCIVVIKSTVPVGTNDKIEKYINKLTDFRIDVVSNPEFLSQGTAVYDTLNSSRIVIGTENVSAANVLKEIYKKFDAPILITNRRSAEMVKYASNDFLALKVSYINEIANLCEAVGADIDDVALGMGYDDRIGRKFLKAGIGYGGSCFPKDTKALHWLANLNGYEIKTIKAAIDVNESQKLKLLKRAKEFFPILKGINIAVLGLTFKPNTDDLRESPSLVNIPIMIDEGANVRAWDKAGIENFKKIYPTQITYCDTIDETIDNADLCFIFTEWDEVKNYPLDKYKKLMKDAFIFDGRNCYKLDDIKRNSIKYICIGKEGVI